VSPSSRSIASGPSSLPAVLLATTLTLVVGYLTKQLCFTIGLGDSFYCFSDYGGLYYGRELAGGRFPYEAPALEYPAGLGLVVWFASAITSSALGFVRANMILLTIACFATVWILWRHAGRRAMLFAAAPSLALYAYLNWDLAAVVFAVAAVVVFLRGRDASAGALVGIGAAIKIFPGLLLLPMVAERWRVNDRRAAWRLLAGATIPLVLLNAPIAWASFDGWAHFLRFNATRPVDWGTLWSVGCQVTGSDLCANVARVNNLALVSFAVLAVVTWALIVRAAPQIPRWQLGLPLMVIFFLTNKVYSPQYSLWILPWFALVLPDRRLFFAYAAVDIGVYVTTFGWQQQLTGSGGLPLWPLHVFLLGRAVVLIAMVVTLTRRAASPAPLLESDQEAAYLPGRRESVFE
jgi:uncharacterized membrane protein